MRSTRAPSPTLTSFSGISSYRTVPYKPPGDKSSVSSPPPDSYQVARIRYDELSKYLSSYLAKEPANSRSASRQKLTRLTRQQFEELSTDVYDELIRRKTNIDNNQVPFLPVSDEFHPKRNQARQKLATLPSSRFKDLSSDVYYELVRRYPEFKEETPDVASPDSTYDDIPSPDFLIAPRECDKELPTPVRRYPEFKEETPDVASPDFPTAPRNRDKELPTPTRFGRLSEDRERPPTPSAKRQFIFRIFDGFPWFSGFRKCENPKTRKPDLGTDSKVDVDYDAAEDTHLLMLSRDKEAF